MRIMRAAAFDSEEKMNVGKQAALQIFSPILLNWLENLGCTALEYTESSGEIFSTATHDTRLVMSFPSIDPLFYFNLHFSQSPPDESLVKNLVSQQIQLLAPLMVLQNIPATFKAVALKPARELVHDLSNCVTSLILSAAVIYIRSGEPTDTKQFSDQIGLDGKICGKYLVGISEMLK